MKFKSIKFTEEQSKKIIEELTNPPELTNEKRAFLEECVRISKKVRKNDERN